MHQRASVFCNFYIRVDREALFSERALDVGSVAFKAMSTKKCFSAISFNTRFCHSRFLNRFCVYSCFDLLELSEAFHSGWH
jgi:hypothetical protein